MFSYNFLFSLHIFNFLWNQHYFFLGWDGQLVKMIIPRGKKSQNENINVNWIINVVLVQNLRRSVYFKKSRRPFSGLQLHDNLIWIFLGALSFTSIWWNMKHVFQREKSFGLCTHLVTSRCLVFLWDWNENWPFPVLWPLLSFPYLLAYWVQHFHSIILQDLK